MKNKEDLLGKYVKFHIGRKVCFGRVSSIEHDVANIRGTKQGKYERIGFHIPVSEIRIASHDEVFSLGREAEAGHL